jgi:hypothetical protein
VVRIKLGREGFARRAGPISMKILRFYRGTTPRGILVYTLAGSERVVDADDDRSTV